MRPLQLRRHESVVASTVREATSEHGLTNVFNPSIATVSGTTHITFRASSVGGHGPFDAYLLSIGPRRSELISLSAHFGEEGIETVADPKLCVLDGDVHVTFNTGYSRDRNALYLARVTPDRGVPVRCCTTSQSRVEKNWGFFHDPEHPDEVGVLYSIDPTETLRCTRAAVRRAEEAADHQVSFSRTGTMPSVVPTRPRLSIASQPVVFGRSMRLLTHERHYLRGRRLYLVRAAELSMDPPHAARVSGVRLFHSARSLLGTRIKHNVNLWSCTYASGLDFDGEVATIAYGINDTDFSIASLEWSRLW